MFKQTLVLIPAILAALLTVSPTQSKAADLSFGIGAVDYNAAPTTTGAVASLEYTSNSIFKLSNIDVHFAVGGHLFSEGDIFVGAGLEAAVPLGEAWSVELGFMPGFYDAGSSAFDLDNDLQFRSTIGLKRHLTDRSAIAVAVSHISNAGLGDTNPGLNTISLHYEFKLWSR